MNNFLDVIGYKDDYMIRKIFLVFTMVLMIFGLNTYGSAYAKNTIRDDELLNLIAGAKGKQVVLVNFYASWCPPCREEMPHLINLRKKYSEDELIMIGINLDESADIMKDFNKKMAVNYTTFHDTGAIQRLYRVEAVPFTVIYGKNGNSIYAKAGYVSEETLTKTVEYGIK